MAACSGCMLVFADAALRDPVCADCLALARTAALRGVLQLYAHSRHAGMGADDRLAGTVRAGLAVGYVAYVVHGCCTTVDAQTLRDLTGAGAQCGTAAALLAAWHRTHPGRTAARPRIPVLPGYVAPLAGAPHER